MTGLEPDDLHHILEAAGRAPSTHNTQPWQFRTDGIGGIDLFVDPDRRLPIADPDDRELRISCGAALFNLEAAARICGLRPDTTLLPDHADPEKLAHVQLRRGRPPTPDMHRVHNAIWKRHTNRWPFSEQRIPSGLRSSLERSARTAGLEFQIVDDIPTRNAMRGLVRAAHQRQQSNADFVTEMRRWTGHLGPRPDGVPSDSGGIRPQPHDEWTLRDFVGDHGRDRLPGKDFESRPVIAVLSSLGDRPSDHLRTGHTMQQMLLDATDRGISASFLSQPVEDPQTRLDLRRLLGGRHWPQLVLRLGYGYPGGCPNNGGSGLGIG